MLYIVLLHYPVYNKEGKIVTTAITNMDIHDIARVARTYAANGFYIVNPSEEQRRLAQEIVNHWQTGYGADFNKFRQVAFELIKIKESLEEVVDDVRRNTGLIPKTVVTGANFTGDVITFAEFKKMLQQCDTPYIIIFGTGSGIADELINSADFKLEAIRSSSGYNHLAVRSAAAIVMDRISGV